MKNNNQFKRKVEEMRDLLKKLEVVSEWEVGVITGKSQTATNDPKRLDKFQNVAKHYISCNA